MTVGTYTACNCSTAGSLSAECDDVTGVCVCRANVTGDKCDSCLSQHYGYFTGNTHSLSAAEFIISSGRITGRGEGACPPPERPGRPPRNVWFDRVGYTGGL